MQSPTNQGTGAGGKRTNEYGLAFEEKVSNAQRLVIQGFRPHLVKLRGKKPQPYLVKNSPDREVVYVCKNAFVAYMEDRYGVKIDKRPDEAYVIKFAGDDVVHVKILEVKNQNRAGSVEEKLLAGVALKRIYELNLSQGFCVSYAYCVSKFLQQRFETASYLGLVKNIIYPEHDISLFYGDDPDYFSQLDKWIDMNEIRKK